jgi:hypothetical protein
MKPKDMPKQYRRGYVVAYLLTEKVYLALGVVAFLSALGFSYVGYKGVQTVGEYAQNNLHMHIAQQIESAQVVVIGLGVGLFTLAFSAAVFVLSIGVMMNVVCGRAVNQSLGLSIEERQEIIESSEELEGMSVWKLLDLF